MNEKIARSKYNQVITESLKNAGFKVKIIDKKSFYDLEDDLRIDHFKFSGSLEERSGHVPLVIFSRKRAEENIEVLLK